MSTPTQSTPTEFAHIVSTPTVMGGEPRVDGHRIRVRDVAAARDIEGHSPEAIVRSVYPSLTLAEVYAALAYYEDHRAEIQAHAAAEAAYLEQFKAEHPGLVTDQRP